MAFKNCFIKSVFLLLMLFCWAALILLNSSPVLAGWPEVIFPSAQGIRLLKGISYTIQWKSVRDDPVNISLCTESVEDGLYCFQDIAVGIPNSGKYSWTVPSSLPNGSNYVIGVGGGTSNAFSDYPFTISGNSIDSTWTAITGSVSLADGTPLCAMVLANGQYMFTCTGDGSFNLEVPLDDNGQITVFAFCSGLAPYKQVIDPAQGAGMQIAMAPGQQGQGMDITCTLNAIDTTWVRLSGNVTYNGAPVCSMVLANGQYMFTCTGDGSFSMDVPLDDMGSITLFGFCDGLPPYERVYGTDQINFDRDFDGDGYSVSGGDCNDLDSSINPSAEEICGDGIDQDCDGSDKNCSSNGEGNWDCEVVTSGPSTLTIINDLNVGVSTYFQNAAFGSDIRPNKCEIYGYSGIRVVEFTQCNFSGDTCYENRFGITVAVSISDGMIIRTSDLF